MHELTYDDDDLCSTLCKGLALNKMLLASDCSCFSFYVRHYFNLYKILILLLFPKVPVGALSSCCSPPLFLWSVTLTKLLIVCCTSRPACPFFLSSVLPPHSVPLESLMAASLRLILLNVVQVDIRGGHATHAQFLYEQRKLFCSNRGKTKKSKL